MAAREDLDLKQLAVRRNGAGDSRIVPKRRIVSRYVLPAALIVGFVGVLGWAARDAYLPRQPVTVVPVLVSLADVQTAGTPLFKAAGWVEPRPTPIRVTALADGVVEELLVVEDQLVEKGDAIAHLVARDAELALQAAQASERIRQAEVEQAQAALEAAQTNFDNPAHLELPVADAEYGLAMIETQLSNLPFELERAQARLRLAEIDLQSKQKASAALTSIIIEQAQSEFDAAQAEVHELTERKPTLEHQRDAHQRMCEAAMLRLQLKTDEREALATAKAALAAAKGRLAEAEVTTAQAQLKLDRMTIVAPVSGRILDLIAAPGMQLMSAGVSLNEDRDSGTVVTMYQPERLQVRVDVRFEDLPRVGRDQPVQIESPAWPQPLNGTVLFLTAFANDQKNTLEVKVTLDNPPPVLKPEMLVDVTFLAPQTDGPETESDEYHLFVPRPLVQTGEGGSFVWVADVAGGTAHRVSVTLGPIQTPTLLEITQGLSAGTRLIATGRESLQEGDRIEITGEDLTFGADEVPPGTPNTPDPSHEGHTEHTTL
jgi:RND family efflux transporter MFP subunit